MAAETGGDVRTQTRDEIIGCVVMMQLQTSIDIVIRIKHSAASG